MKAILDHWVGNRSEDTEHTIVSTGGTAGPAETSRHQPPHPAQPVSPQ